MVEGTFQEWARDAYITELQRLAERVVQAGDVQKSWLWLHGDGLIPDVPEAKSVYFGSQLWPLHYRLPLNKKLISDVIKRFIDLGWKEQPWMISDSMVQVQLQPNPEWKVQNKWCLDIWISAGGEAEGCKIVKIYEKEDISVNNVYELVCETGAQEGAL